MRKGGHFTFQIIGLYSVWGKWQWINIEGAKTLHSFSIIDASFVAETSVNQVV